MNALLVEANSVKRKYIFIDKMKMSFQDICCLYPKRIKKLLLSFDLQRKGLEAGKKAVQQNDLPSACEALITYYRKEKTAAWLQRPVVEYSNAINSDQYWVVIDKISTNPRKIDSIWNFHPDFGAKENIVFARPCLVPDKLIS